MQKNIEQSNKSAICLPYGAPMELNEDKDPRDLTKTLFLQNRNIVCFAKLSLANLRKMIYGFGVINPGNPEKSNN